MPLWNGNNWEQRQEDSEFEDKLTYTVKSLIHPQPHTHTPKSQRLLERRNFNSDLIQRGNNVRYSSLDSV